MPVVASRDTQHGAVVEGSAGRCPPDSRTEGSAIGWQARADAVQEVRERCEQPTHPRRKAASGWRRFGVVLSSLVVDVLRRVERQEGFCGA